jgi:glycosyltransferase involved in cell wall biosynthesis
VVRELLRSLAARKDPHRYILYARQRWDEPLGDRFQWALSRRRDPWWNVAAARAASRTCDALLSTNSYLTAWFTSVPTVLVVYDMVAFDASLRPSRRSGVIERLTLPYALRRAAGVVCISEATAAALGARFARARNVIVAPLGVSAALRPSPDPADPAGDFVLAVGTLEPRKNLPRLVKAYSSLPRSLQQAHPLVVVGRIGWDASDTVSALRGLGDRCRLLGQVSDARLAALYERCTVFAYPSLGEGFGLPVLEAMAAGAAVVTSDRSSLPEVGGDAVEYADPANAASIRQALERLLTDVERRERLGAAARRRAAMFSWDAFAQRTLGAAVAAAAQAGSGVPRMRAS